MENELSSSDFEELALAARQLSDENSMAILQWNNVTKLQEHGGLLKRALPILRAAVDSKGASEAALRTLAQRMADHLDQRARAWSKPSYPREEPVLGMLAASV